MVVMQETMTICYWDPDGKGHRTGWMPLSPDVRGRFHIAPAGLAVHYGPQEIRDHFDGDPDDPTEGLTDEQLVAIGEAAVTDDRTWETFHEVLVDTLAEASRERMLAASMRDEPYPPRVIPSASQEDATFAAYDGEVAALEHVATLADAVNQLAMLIEDMEYARTTGLRSNSSEFKAKQDRLRQMRERVAPLIEP